MWCMTFANESCVLVELRPPRVRDCKTRKHLLDYGASEGAKGAASFVLLYCSYYLKFISPEQMSHFLYLNYRVHTDSAHTAELMDNTTVERRGNETTRDL